METFQIREEIGNKGREIDNITALNEKELDKLIQKKKLPD